MSDTHSKQSERELYEKVESLFNLRISSSGNDIGILFPGKDESMRVWIDYEDFLRFRQSIEGLVQQEVNKVLSGLLEKQLAYIIDMDVNPREELAVPVSAIESYMKGGSK